ncbi:hypothetical protein COOONC_00227 [Cooperia oncophora]
MYGKSGWLMRSFEEWPENFEQTSSFQRPGASLLLPVASQAGAIRLGRNPDDEVLSRSLRNLDRIPGTEYHAVGVLYVTRQQETEAQILANVHGSERYARFLKWVDMFHFAYIIFPNRERKSSVGDAHVVLSSWYGYASSRTTFVL